MSRHVIVLFLCLSLFSFSSFASSCFTRQNPPTDSSPSHHHGNDAHHSDSGDHHATNDGHNDHDDHDGKGHACCKNAEQLHSSIVQSAPPTVATFVEPLPFIAVNKTTHITLTLHPTRHTRAPPAL